MSFFFLSLGSLGAIFQVFIVLGILYSYVFGSIVNYMLFNILCGVWAIIHIIGVFFIPESPYYLLSKNADELATMALMRLRDTASTDTARELSVLKVINPV